MKPDLLLYCCDVCGRKVNFQSTRKAFGKRYCAPCFSTVDIGVLSSERKARRDLKGKQKEEYDLMLDNMIEELAVSGPKPLAHLNIPLRLKRNERVYLLARRFVARKFSIASALTNQRMFFASPDKILRTYFGNKASLSISRGIKAISLSTVIAIEEPVSNLDRTGWKITIHLDKGKDVSFDFERSQEARLCHVLLAEMVDRLNDPIDDAAFSPRRERTPDDVKVAVWRRDGGVCVRCGSRKNLEYDHIIPVSKGGSNTVRNIELLCESCNRKKSNRVM